MSSFKFRYALMILLLFLPLAAQQMSLSKDTLTFSGGTYYFDEIQVHNTGTSVLVIDSMMCVKFLNYQFFVTGRDTSYAFWILSGRHILKVNSGDTLRLKISRPYCPVCKTEEFTSDTIVIRSNALISPMRRIVVHADGSLEVPEQTPTPTIFTLAQNFPNPFNPSTTIPFTLAQRSMVTLTVHNALGQRIAVLHNGTMEAGEHSVQWNADGFASGLYFYSLTSDGRSATRAMMLLR